MIGLLRVIRCIAGLIFIMQIVGIIPGLSQLNHGEIVAIVLLKLIVAIIAIGIFFGLRKLITNLYVKKYGVGHPTLGMWRI